jgi:hypothetical protein
MMTTEQNIPAIDALKQQAKRLRQKLVAEGNDISHGRVLELIAGQYGFRDWNTLSAIAMKSERRNSIGPLTPGAKVSGRYLGQRFDGTVVGVQLYNDTGRQRVTIDFNEPVDVVKFESFSAFRRRVTSTIGPDGRTLEKTSDGEPHMVLEI